MVLNYYSERLVGIVFLVAVAMMAGMYLFPESTLNIIGMAAAGSKPAVAIISYVLGNLKELIIALLSAI